MWVGVCVELMGVGGGGWMRAITLRPVSFQVEITASTSYIVLSGAKYHFTALCPLITYTRRGFSHKYPVYT